MQFINSVQTKEERRLKYWFLRCAGVNEYQARKMRDFTYGHLVRFIAGYKLRRNEKAVNQYIKTGMKK